MSLKQNIISFLMRKHFDFDKPDLDLYKFHPQLRVVLALTGIFFENRTSKIRFLNPAYNIALCIVATALEFVCIYHGVTVRDYEYATECFSYIIVLLTTPFVNQNILCNSEKILTLLGHMNDDFVYVCHLEPRYRNKFLKGQLLIWQLFTFWYFFCGFIVVIFVSNAFALLFYQSLLSQGDHATRTRPMVFPLWLPKDDPYRSPNYEIFMVVEILVLLNIMQGFVGYIYTMFHYLLHCYYMIDMILIDIDCLFDDVDDSVVRLDKEDPRRVRIQNVLNNRMKRIVNWHTHVLRSVETVSSIYGPTLVYQLTLSSLIICLTAYQVVTQLENGKVNFLFAILCVAAIAQLWIPCFLGTLMMEKALLISDACFNSGWYKSPVGSMIRQDLMIVILRAHKPLLIRFVGLPMLTLETFSSIMSSSYTYLNVLLQSTKN